MPVTRHRWQMPDRWQMPVTVLLATKQSSRGYTTSQMADASDTSQMANASDQVRHPSQRRMGTRVQSLLKFHSKTWRVLRKTIQQRHRHQVTRHRWQMPVTRVRHPSLKDGNESTESTQIPLKKMKSFKKNNSTIAVLPTRQRSQCYTKSQMAEPIDKKSQMANASDRSLRLYLNIYKKKINHYYFNVLWNISSITRIMLQ